MYVQGGNLSFTIKFLMYFLFYLYRTASKLATAPDYEYGYNFYHIFYFRIITLFDHLYSITLIVLCLINRQANQEDHLHLK